MRDALGTLHMGRVIYAYRNHPWHRQVLKQSVVAGWFGLTQTQLSRIENGRAPEEISKLVRWAKLLGIPAGLRWFKVPGEEGPQPVPARMVPVIECGTLSKRDTGFFGARRALALALSGEPDEASAAGLASAKIARETSSERTIRLLGEVARELQPWSSRPQVRELRQAVLAAPR
jgi:transcriptional regulator with XRE-family HTH domain